VLFEIGDQVVHPIYGVGTVKTLSAQRFGAGQTRQYYEVATGDATVWVPIDEQGFTVLREIASKRSLGECRRLLCSDPEPLEANHKMRQLEIAARLNGGLLPALCGMVRDLRARSSQAPLGQTEDRVLRRIFKVLCEEWAASDGVSAQVALHEIEDLLRVSRESQLPQEGLGTSRR
jgi:RNA polymerase-interacting CarD/CdnL/TRCF family regulator